MTTLEEAARIVSGVLGTKQNSIEWKQAMLGDGHGNVQDTDNKVFVRLAENSSVISVLNYRVPPVDGMLVRIAKTPEMPLHWQVIGQDDQRLDGGTGGAGGGIVYNTPLHALTHGYLGVDQVNVDWRQITTLRVYAYSGLTIGVLAGLLPRPGADLVVPTQTLDLTAHLPVSGALYCLISVDSAGALVATDGTPASSVATLTLGDIPDTPAGNFRLAAVRLYAGQTSIRETTTNNDMRDLRWPQERLASSITPGDMTLTDAHIFVGNASNLAADVAMSGDATIANTGALTLKNTGPGATGPIGSATVAPIITIDAQGRVTALSSATITPAAGSITPAMLAAASAQYKYLVSGATPFSYAESGGALNIATGKTLTVNNSLTLTQTLAGGPFTLDLNANLTVSEVVATPKITINSASLSFGGNFTATVPATGTVAIGAGTLTSATTNNVSINGHTHAITGSPALLGNGTSQYQVIVTGATPFAPVYSVFLLDGTTGGKTVFAVTNTKVLTLTATDSYNLTIPATGTAALGTGAATRIAYWSGANALTSDANLIWNGTQLGVGVASPHAAASLDVSGNIKFPSARAFFNPDILFFGGNAYYNGAWRAVTNGAAIAVRFGNDANPFSVYYDTGLTADASYTPTRIMKSHTNGALTVGGASASYSQAGLLINLAGDNILSLQDTSTQMFSIRTQAAGGRVSINTQNSQRLVLGVDAGTSEGSLTEHLTIDSSGQVGIGLAALATPGAKAEILGNAYAGALIVGSSATQGAITTGVVTIKRNDSLAGVAAMLGLTALGSGANGDGGSILLAGKSSTTAAVAMGLDEWLWVNATHASRTARRVFSVYDTAVREAIRIEASGSAAMIGFLGAAAVARQANIVNADGTLADITTKFNTLLAQLQTYGLQA